MNKLILSILLIIVPTLVFGLIGKVAEMSVILVAGIACAGVINMDKFSNFSIGTNGLEAQLKEAKEIINEANITIEDLKSFIEPLLNANINFIIYDGYLNGMQLKTKEQTIQDLYNLSNKQELEIDKQLFVKATKVMATQYFIQLRYLINNDDFNNYFDKYINRTSMFGYPTVEEIDEFFSENTNLINEKIKFAIDNYKRYYTENLKLLTQEPQ